MDVSGKGWWGTGQSRGYGTAQFKTTPNFFHLLPNYSNKIARAQAQNIL